MNLIFWPSDKDREGIDGEVNSVLSPLDPGHTNAAYWVGFHEEAMDRARFELARRRRKADLTVAGTLSAWSRAVVPAALVAAAAAGILLVQSSGGVAHAPLTLSEVLTMGSTDPVPAVSDLDDDEELPVHLAAEIY